MQRPENCTADCVRMLLPSDENDIYPVCASDRTSGALTTGHSTWDLQETSVNDDQSFAAVFCSLRRDSHGSGQHQEPSPPGWY